MKLYYYLFATLLFLGLTPKSWGQSEHFNCGHDAYMKKIWEENPQLKEDYKQLFENSKQVYTDGFQSKTVFTIPIVFHIIHENGSENISDAQVYDQMEVLNRDYMLENADISNAVAGFDTVAGKAEIQFKLAAIDPWGNCTNGIEHIYSHETWIGDDYSKLNQWPRSRYLNVWVVTKMRNGVAGYAYYPTATDGALFFADGIIILHPYIGRIGTGSEGKSRALTHEIGHYLGLPHVWGDTNEPMVACGDDGIEDTPVTKGFNFCPQTLAAASVCDPTIVENYQNYMDYSYCSIMFTKDQVSLMRNMLQSESGNRKYLISDSIHHLTGIDLPTVPLCAPVADFSAEAFVACVNKPIVFKDQSWNSVVDAREWSFQDGTASSNTTAQPSVTFTSHGWKKVTLTVSNSAGTDTKTVEKAIYVYPDYGAELKSYSFNDGTVHEFIPVNPEPESPGFEITWNRGVNSSAAYVLKYYKDIQNPIMYSNDYFYNLRKGGSKDYLYSPNFNLQYVTGGAISFDISYASGAFSIDEMTETLELQSSIDCGKNWIPRKTLTKMDLVTGGNASTDVDFIPTASQWKTIDVAIPAALQKNGVQFRFAFTASDKSNNLYIDNVNISGTLMTSSEEFSALNFNVYPNPTTAAEGVYVEYMANDKDVTLELVDMAGKVIATEVVKTKNTSVNHKINTSTSLTAGIYMVKISQGTNQLVKKVVIL